MELKTNVRALSYIKKRLLGDTEDILPFPVRVQKPVPQQRPCVPLPRCTAAQAQIPSGALDEFLRILAQTPQVNAHHALVLRHGKVVCEAHYAPYEGKYWHVSHSLCKTFTGSAIGMLVEAGELALEECLCDIFPEKCTLLTSRRMREVTVKHLLTMRSGVNFREMGSVLEADWLAAFIGSDFLFAPGTDFNYNSMNSYVLSAIVTKKTGKTVFEYLTPRLFEPLGFGSVAWESCPLGISKGGWGLYLLPEDLVKMGQLYLQEGLWEGKRILSKAWVNAVTQPASTLENGEEYGCHIWTHSADGSYLLNGMFGQYVWVVPSLDMVVVVNAGSTNLFTHGPTAGAIAQLLAHVQHAAQHAVPATEPQDAQALAFTMKHLRFNTPIPPLPQTEKAPWHRRMANALGRPIVIDPVAPATIAPQCTAFCEKTYCFAANQASLLPMILSSICDYYTKGVEELSFCVKQNQFFVLWKENGIVQKFPVGFASATICQLNFGGNIFVAGVSGTWTTDEDDHPVLKLIINLLETTSTQTIKCFFLPEGLRLQLAEQPALGLVVELLQKTNPEFLNLKFNTGVLKDLDYVTYKFNQYCVPTLLGHQKDEAAL